MNSPNHKHSISTIITNPGVTDASHILPINRLVSGLLLDVVQFALPVIEIVLPKSSVNLILVCVGKNPESTPGLRLVTLASVDIAVLILEGQLLEFRFLLALVGIGVLQGS